MDVKQEIEQLRAALSEAMLNTMFWIALPRAMIVITKWRLEELEKVYPEYITLVLPPSGWGERRSPDLKRSATVFRWKVFGMCFPWKNSPTSTSASMRALGMWEYGGPKSRRPLVALEYRDGLLSGRYPEGMGWWERMSPKIFVPSNPFPC